MISRFDGRRIFVNRNEIYQDVFRERNVNHIEHYETAKLRYPTSEEISELQIIGKIWGVGDRFWKLAQVYYGSAELWWIIAHYNMKHEFDVENGEVIYIPLPLEKILRFLGV